jgi:hypothetical protein
MPLGQPKQPVAEFPLKFAWNTGPWEKIFDAQIELIRADIKRARFDGKIIVYLSCPLSGRGGGHAGTNVEIAKFTERRLLSEWGERFWILNPGQYQLESKEGFGLLDLHAQKLDIKLPELLADPNEKVGGGDYMRMWTKILVESYEPGSTQPKTLGLDFDAFYFLGPSDVRAFFDTQSKVSLGASIEEYFARKHSFDRGFRDFFSVHANGGALTEAQNKDWDARRRAFLLFYSLRASATTSLGCHDEWAIFKLLNQARRKVPDLGIANQLAGFFDGKALPLSTGEAEASLGYAL